MTPKGLHSAWLVAGLLAMSCSTSLEMPDEPGVVHPAVWEASRSGVSRDPAIEARVSQLLGQMSLEDKVGQIIQADINTVTPEDVREYRLGSILNGGGSGPDGDDRALAPLWLKAADAFYDASMATPQRIPLLWGSDAVHGNSNIIGATIFPHNIGLGAANDPDLIRRIGEVTAKELRVIGQDWTFAPTIAVVRDDRWGRTYESYAEDPGIVTAYARAIVEGIQGRPGDADFLVGRHVIATAKHFLGDGGTRDGHDQGDNLHSEKDLHDIFAPPYRAAIEAGVQTVMASYNSWRGQKMHVSRSFLTDILVGRLGFDGFVVGDWNGHAQPPGCSKTNCPQAINAGLDMYMAPDSWKGLYETTLAQVKSGVISEARLDEAVARVLRVKLRARLWEAGRPSSRQFAGDWSLLGAPEHRAVAREAVRKSLVLLKNDRAILPLHPKLNVLVAGDGADNMAKQTGGWTISWQGTGNTRADFPHADTILEGVRAHVEAAGGTVQFSPEGAWTRKPDVALVVFGEDPYAEFSGDRDHLDFEPEEPLALMRKLSGEGVPVVAVFLSGRPLYVTAEINAADAFVAAWLPGTEGAGLADVLFRRADGGVAHDFAGRLSFSWPKAPDQFELNVGDAGYDPLFPFGYGLSYAAPRTLGMLPEASADALAAVRTSTRYMRLGRVMASWRDASTGVRVVEVENGMRVLWPGAGEASYRISGSEIDLSRQATADMALVATLSVEIAPKGRVRLGVVSADGRRGARDITELLTHPGRETTIAVRLSCFAGADMKAIVTPLELTSDGPMSLTLKDVKIEPGEGPPTCPPAAL